ncbi:MAG TPA: RsmE family RNA methyltransferase [Rectinemataceae bacterium]|nr:RsmE family RNA methyltransferase [Rectinemataceae bacterium]
MRQFLIPEEWEGGPTCEIAGGRARYLTRVLRLVAGDEFPGLDPRGRRWLCRVGEAGQDRVILELSALPPTFEASGLEDVRGGRGSVAAPSAPPAQPGPLPPIVLVQGLPKGAKMDLIVRQAAEAGLAAVLPLLAERSVAREGREAEAKRARWERIAREAIQQSGSARPTAVAPITRLAELPVWLAQPPRGQGRVLKLLLHEAPLAQASLHGYLTEAPDEIVLCVGPEGGFAPGETDFLLASGFLPLRLAGAILRTETAALYAVAAVETIISERSSWIPKPQ